MTFYYRMKLVKIIIISGSCAWCSWKFYLKFYWPSFAWIKLVNIIIISGFCAWCTSKSKLSLKSKNLRNWKMLNQAGNNPLVLMSSKLNKFETNRPRISELCSRHLNKQRLLLYILDMRRILDMCPLLI